MLNAITAQVPTKYQALADRSIAAASGALFGLVVTASVAMATGRAPFQIDPAILMLYGSVIPLSIAGFMMKFSREAPKLPMLATLWFTALFVGGMFFGEVASLGKVLNVGSASLSAHSFVGFRAIVVAALSGLVFTGIRADGELFADDDVRASTVDTDTLYRDAVRRLALVDVEMKRSDSRTKREMAEFDRRLAAAMRDTEVAEDEWALDVAEVGESAAAYAA